MSLTDFQRIIDMGMPTTQIIAEVKATAQRIFNAENIKEEPKGEVKEEIKPVVTETITIIKQKYFAEYRVIGTERELLSLSAYLKSQSLEYSVVNQGEI